MTSEKRLVRPYSGLFLFQVALDRCTISIGGVHAEAGKSLVVGSSSFVNDPVVLRFAEDEESRGAMCSQLLEAISALELEARDVELLVVARTPYLRLADIVHRRSLDDPDAVPEQLTLRAGDDVRALLTPSGGCDLHVYFCLAREQTPRPLRPNRIGTWLGHTSFRLRTELGEIGFTPRPLTDERRKELQLPKGTIRFVEVEAEALLGENIDDAVELFVDEDLLGHLNRAADSPASRAFQRQLFVDAMAAVARALPRVPGLSSLELADIDGTVLGRIVDAIAGRPKRGDSEDELRKRREDALALVRNDGERFVAHAEALVDPKEDLRLDIGGFD